MSTQCERLLRHLETHQSIDPMQALGQLGIYRLGARIFDLREAGHAIHADRKIVHNRFGEECRVAVYTLEKSNA